MKYWAFLPWVVMASCFIVLGSLAGCRASVPVDPRDKDVVEEISRVKKELNVHVKNDYWGEVAIYFVARGGSKWRLGTYNTSSKVKTKTVSKAVFSFNDLSILIVPFGLGPTAPVSDAYGLPPRPGSRFSYLVRHIYISPGTVDMWIDVAQQLAQTSVTWR